MLARIGNVEVWRLLESDGPLMPFTRFFPDLSPEDIEAHRDLIGARGLSVDVKTGLYWLCLPVQAFLLKTPDKLVLVDGCVGNHKSAPSMKLWHQMNRPDFMEAFAATGFLAEDVDYVLCTHLHIDHAGWTTSLVDGEWVPTFPNARVLTNKAELDEAWQAAQDPNTLASHIWRETIQPLMDHAKLDIVDADYALDDDIRLWSTPGHTPGHVSIEIRVGEDLGAVVTGDVVHSPIQCAMPHIHTIADTDPELAVETRARFFARMADTGAKTFATHFPLPSVGHIVRDGDVFDWKLEED